MTPEGVQFNEIDRHFAAFVCRQAGSREPHLEAAALLLSRGVTAGDVCLDLCTALEEGRTAGYRLESVAAWREQLAATAVVGAPGDFKPLILDQADRLYLQRYWRYEHELAEAIRKRGEPAEFDKDLLRQGLERLFPRTPGETDWQRVAALAAVTRRFCVISGGPGTGKTSTVVKVLSLLLQNGAGPAGAPSSTPEAGKAAQRSLRIALAAPTGKAAARLKESIAAGLDKAEEQVRDLIPEEVFTLHRLLGYLKGSSGFRHNGENPLPYDVVIVDEASMVSLPLMAKLVCALRRDTRLILLGDRDQLASVEAGAVLGDICDTGVVHGFSAGFAALAAELAGDDVTVQPGLGPLGDAVVLLKKSYRFSSTGGIGKVGALVNQGNAPGALAACLDPALAEVSLASLPPAAGLAEALAKRITDGYAAYLHEETPEAAFTAFSRFRILCAMRNGPYGVEALNHLVRQRLAQAGLIHPHGRWYAGEPVMITRNDYNLGLFNGDVGLILPDAESGGELRAFFPSGSGGIRKVLPLRLPEYECAFAMTVHKSQGSEFDRVLLVLPDRDTPLLTRELLYTAITRAKKSVEMLAEETLFLTAVERRVVRRSGLRELLWGLSSDT